MQLNIEMGKLNRKELKKIILTILKIDKTDNHWFFNALTILKLIKYFH